MIPLTQHKDGLVLPVRAQPRAKKNGPQGEHNGALKVAVTAPPEDGRANKALIAVLAKVLKLKKSQIELLTGATSRDKTFLLREVTAEEIQDRMAEILAAST